MTGAIYINENDDVNLGDDSSGNTYGLRSTNGPIYITAANTADGDLIATSVSVTGANAAITLITNEGIGGLNNIQVGSVSTGTDPGGVVTLISDNNITDKDADTDVDVTAYELFLEANGSVGAKGANQELDTDVGRICNRSATGNVYGNIYIIENDFVGLGSVNGLSTDVGDIDVTAGGTITASSVTAGGDGDVYLTTTATDADISIHLITAVGDDIYLNSGRYIIDMLVDNQVDIVGKRLYLTAGASVGLSGSDYYLDTQVETIDDYATGTNTADNIYISEYDGVNLGSINGLTTDDGSIYVTSNATADGTLIATNVTAGGAGDVVLTSQVGDTVSGNVNDISIGVVTADGDDVILDSNDDILDLSLDSAVDIEADGLYLAANGSVGGDGSNQELDTNVATIDDKSGTENVYENIYIIEYDGVTLGSVNGLSTDTGDIDITAAHTAAGTLTATDVTAGDEGNVYLETEDGGGVDNDIVVGTITAEDDDVTLVSDAAVTDGDTDVDIVASALYLQTGANVGALADYLDTRVDTIDDYTGGNVGTDLYINEYDGVTLGSLNTTTGLSTTDGEIRIIAAASDAGTLTASLLTAGGDNNDIYLTTLNGGSGDNDIAMGLVTAADDDVWLNADNDITDADLDSASDVVASGLYLTAGGSVGADGSSQELDTTVDTIDDYSTTQNVTDNIYIIETDAVTLGSSTQGLTTDNGIIDITAGGTITTNVITAANAVHLESTGGDILDNTVGTTLITAGATSSLKASGVIGSAISPYDPVDVNINGDLWVWAGSEQDEVSVITQGTVKSSGATERVEIYEPAPPGLVIHDNHLMGGSNYGSGSLEGSILSRGYGVSVLTKGILADIYYTRVLEPWGYQLQTNWVVTEGPFMDEDFLQGPEVIIDGSQVGITILPPQLLINPARFQPQNYYIIRKK